MIRVPIPASHVSQRTDPIHRIRQTDRDNMTALSPLQLRQSIVAADSLLRALARSGLVELTADRIRVAKV